MKITHKERFAVNETFDIFAELDNGKEIQATLTVYDSDNIAIPEYDLTILDDIKLTDEEHAELLDLATQSPEID